MEKQSKKLYKLKKWLLKYNIHIAVIAIIVVLILNIYLHRDKGLPIAIYDCFKFFAEHFWLEILSGIVIWLLLESKFDKYSNMPKDTYNREYEELSKNIATSTREVKILDNEINCFYTKVLNFEETLRIALENSENENIKILLLHPGSEAAKQRRNDFFNSPGHYSSPIFDIFIEMRDGLKKLHHTIEKLNKLHSKKKIEVKLFNSTHSIIFVSWNESINFSFIPSNSSSDDHSFGTETNTPLAKYFINNYFNGLWNNKNITTDLDDYQYVKIIDKNGNLEVIGKEDSQYPLLFYWGSDSTDHNLPIFLCTKDEVIPDSILNYIKDKIELQILHNNEIKWALLQEIKPRNISEGETTLYSFAIEQIQKKHICNIGNQRVFKIKYLHHHRINIKDGNYVKKHLKERGYCHVPSIMFETYLGMRLKSMLFSLYDFFLSFRDFSSVIDKSNLDRIIVTYKCEIIKSEINVERTVNDEEDNIYKLRDINDEVHQRKKDALLKFLVSTIKSDIDNILGKFKKIDPQNTNSTNLVFRDKIETYKVKAHLLQIVVNENTSKANPQGDNYKENNGKYTVLHLAGKRNILGGISEIKYNNNTHIKYNLITPLDSLFLTKEISIKRQQELEEEIVKINLESEFVSYSQDEADERVENEIRNKKLNPQSDQEEIQYIINHNKLGYRNIVVIEFFEI